MRSDLHANKEDVLVTTSVMSVISGNVRRLARSFNCSRKEVEGRAICVALIES